MHHVEIMVPSIMEIEFVKVNSGYEILKMDIADDNYKKLVSVSHCLQRIALDLEKRALEVEANKQKKDPLS